MSVTEQGLLAALSRVLDPHTGQDYVSTRALRNLQISGGDVRFEVELGYPAHSLQPTLRSALAAAAQAVPGVQNVSVSFSTKIIAHAVQRGVQLLPGVKNIIAVASGKGGVGKSTTAVNLALALAAEGAKVGVLDADIYGPSIPRMLGLSGKPDTVDGKRIVPKRGHGLEAMSIGLLIDEDTPMIWRGPMVTQALQQLFSETAWGDLDYLVIDLPPGTGDIHLSMCQRVPVSGAIVVTTPQDIALLDAKKALKMFEKVEVPVLGIVENMAIHVCSNCGHAEHIFGHGGGQRMSEQYNVPLLGSLPLDISIREQADGGAPTVAAKPDSAAAAAYRDIARKTAARLSLRARNKAIAFPKVMAQ